MRQALVLAVCLPLLYPSNVHAADPPYSYLVSEITALRQQLGKPLLETVISFNNEKDWVLERLTPQGASFAVIKEKKPGENFDALRERSVFALSITTCPGSKALDAKISSIIAWEAFSVEASTKETAFMAVYVQRLLELVNTPPSISSPSTMRAPRSGQLKGLVFEYVKGDTTENVSFINELDQQASNAERLSWQVTNTSFCPKS